MGGRWGGRAGKRRRSNIKEHTHKKSDDSYDKVNTVIQSKRRRRVKKQWKKIEKGVYKDIMVYRKDSC